jgi:Cupin-like domain
MKQNGKIQAVAANRVTHEWRRWIAENLLLNAHPANLVEVLCANKIERNEAMLEVDAAMKSPYLQGGARLKNRLGKRDWIVNIQAKLNRLQPLEIPRKHRLSAEEFLRDHYSTNRPVIITGMMDDWPALKKWNLNYFREHFAEREVEVQFGRDADANYELNSIAHKRKMRFGDYVDLIEQKSPTNDFYMTANNDAKNRDALIELWQDLIQVPEYLEPSQSNRGFFWLGPAGTVTPLHHDLTNNFMAQVIGRKKVRLISVAETARLYNHRHCFTQADVRNIDPRRFPDMVNVPIAECILAPGEILFLPVGCWHYVEALDISVTMAFTNFRWDNDFYTNYPTEHDF